MAATPSDFGIRSGNIDLVYPGDTIRVPHPGQNLASSNSRQSIRRTSDVSFGSHSSSKSKDSDYSGLTTFCYMSAAVALALFCLGAATSNDVLTNLGVVALLPVICLVVLGAAVTYMAFMVAGACTCACACCCCGCR